MGVTVSFACVCFYMAFGGLDMLQHPEPEQSCLQHSVVVAGVLYIHRHQRFLLLIALALLQAIDYLEPSFR